MFFCTSKAFGIIKIQGRFNWYFLDSAILYVQCENFCFVTVGQKCSYFEMDKRDTIMYVYQGQTLFCVILNGIRTKKWHIYYDILILKECMHHNVPGWHKLHFTIQNKHIGSY